MSKYDARGYRLVKWKWIYLLLFIYFVVFTVVNILSSGTTALLLTPMFCLALGWQLGCVSERNDWQKWYDTQIQPALQETNGTVPGEKQ